MMNVTELLFQAYDRNDYCNTIGRLVASIPDDKSVFLLGRYSFDDYYLSFMYKSIKEGNRFYYIIGGRKIEFLTAHKSKGLEADYVILRERKINCVRCFIRDDFGIIQNPEIVP